MYSCSIILERSSVCSILKFTYCLNEQFLQLQFIDLPRMSVGRRGAPSRQCPSPTDRQNPVGLYRAVGYWWTHGHAYFNSLLNYNDSGIINPLCNIVFVHDRSVENLLQVCNLIKCNDLWILFAGLWSLDVEKAIFFGRAMLLNKSWALPRSFWKVGQNAKRHREGGLRAII